MVCVSPVFLVLVYTGRFLGKVSPDTAHLALRERQHSWGHVHCKHEMSVFAVFRAGNLPYRESRYAILWSLKGQEDKSGLHGAKQTTMVG
jgi:hypothetical protein